MDCSFKSPTYKIDKGFCIRYVEYIYLDMLNNLLQMCDLPSATETADTTTEWEPATRDMPQTLTWRPYVLLCGRPSRPVSVVPLVSLLSSSSNAQAGHWLGTIVHSRPGPRAPCACGAQPAAAGDAGRTRTAVSTTGAGASQLAACQGVVHAFSTAPARKRAAWRQEIERYRVQYTSESPGLRQTHSHGTGTPRRWPSAVGRSSCGLFCSLTPPPPHPSALSGRRPTTTPAASALPRPGSRLCQPAAWPSASSTVRALRTATSSTTPRATSRASCTPAATSPGAGRLPPGAGARGGTPTSSPARTPLPSRPVPPPSPPLHPTIAAAWYPAAQGWTGKIKPFWFGANHTGLDSEATLALMSKHSVAGYGWQTGGAGQDGVCATVLPVPLDSYAANS